LVFFAYRRMITGDNYLDACWSARRVIGADKWLQLPKLGPPNEEKLNFYRPQRVRLLAWLMTNEDVNGHRI
jgi:hypothetical protein